MRHLPRQHRFTAWDGSQKLPIDADQVMAALADDLIEFGDLRWAMRNLVSRGMQIPQGGYLQGLRDMLKEVRDRKRGTPAALRPLRHLRRLPGTARRDSRHGAASASTNGCNPARTTRRTSPATC